MALSTTQSIWRSGGGDQTRTAYCGSGVMAAEFYIADDSVSGNVKVSSAANAANLILPAGAVVLSVAVITIDGTASAEIDLGTTGFTSGTAVGDSIASALPVDAAGTTSIGSIVTGTALTEMSYVTSEDNGTSTGGDPVGGFITYFVVDPLAGQQNV
jgi:hypothetical protein